MEQGALPSVVEEAFDRADAALAAVARLGLDPRDIDEANACLRRVEGLRRGADSALAGFVVAVDASGVFAREGHRNPATWMVRVGRLSRPEARRRLRLARTVRDLPAVAKAFQAGDVGSCQLDRISRVLRNPRVRAHAIALDEDLAVLAAGLSYDELDRKLTEWERLVDADGAGRFDRQHRGRSVQVSTDLDGGLHLRSRHDSVDGAELRAILVAYAQDELDADWAEARERLGDLATWSDLRRSDAQRQADAMLQIFRDANAHRGQTPGRSSVQTIVVVDLATAEAAARNLDPDEPDINSAAGHPGGGPGLAPDLTLDPDPAGVDGRSSALDGHPVDPTEAIRRSLVGGIRGAVFDPRGVCINLGRNHRFYRNYAQVAARLSRLRCEGAACDCPVTRTQTDHIVPWRQGGATDQDNAACLCGHHNRLKEQGFTMTRGPDGRVRWFRPDGTEIT